MIHRKATFPSEGEILIGTVKNVFDYGSYISLDEYPGVNAFLPWSEISTKWVRNVRDIVKEGRKVVVKVIRLDRKKGSVDVSLKKVTDDERRKKNIEWKKLQKLDKILEIVASRLGKDEKLAWEEVEWKLESKYDDPMGMIEKATKEGPEILLKAGISEEWVKPLLEEASKHVEERKVKESEILSIKTMSGSGVEVMKNVLDKAISSVLENRHGFTVKLYTIGAPRYRLDVIGTEPKETSKVLQEIVESLLNNKGDVEIQVVKK
jgi:translation initiation factor 2 subunit 1